MRVLIACEFSGIVREAFRDKGHDAWSCDLLPTEIPGQHIQGDVLNILNDGWDLMIAHPPCTYLSYAAIAYWNRPGRCKQRLEALEFFRQLWEAPIEKICIENPRGCASPTIAKYTQIIQPYFFGDYAKKTTCLWLKNLPPLQHSAGDMFTDPTHTEEPQPLMTTKRGKKIYFCDSFPPSENRAKERSRTFTGIANAMAEQWG
jgi:hypothetical protein